jgi:hypothetical protein
LPKQEYNTEDSLSITKYQFSWSGVFLLLGVYKISIFSGSVLKEFMFILLGSVLI